MSNAKRGMFLRAAPQLVSPSPHRRRDFIHHQSTLFVRELSLRTTKRGTIYDASSNQSKKKGSLVQPKMRASLSISSTRVTLGYQKARSHRRFCQESNPSSFFCSTAVCAFHHYCFLHHTLSFISFHAIGMMVVMFGKAVTFAATQDAF